MMRKLILRVWVAGLASCGGDSATPNLDAAIPQRSDAAVAGTAAHGGAGASAQAGNTSAGAAAAGRASSSSAGVGGKAGATAAGSGGSAALPAGWKLVWADEFDGPAGSAPDSSRWVADVGGTGWGNNQLEFDTARTENAAHDGQGMLVITARKESYMGKMYTSARLKTQAKFEHTYGRYEARMRIPAGQGMWPAFWMLGANIGMPPWPECGEIDIMENIGKEPNLVHGTLHGPGYSGGNGIGAPAKLDGSAKYADDFHVFAIEWEKDVVRWYVDDKLYQTRKPSDLPSGTKWVYDHGFFILLNLAVGGTWPGNPDATTMFPQTLRVDYVRVYDRG